MSTSLNETIRGTRTRCAVCASSHLECAVALPGLPLTDRFARTRCNELPPGIDQALLWCSRCGHGQLANLVDPAALYDSAYSFRTSESAVARHGTAFLLRALDAFASGRRFTCAVDVGCNDVYLLEQLGDRASRRIGIDPIWAGREQEAGEGIEVIGTKVEDADLPSRLESAPDLIILRHTIEHIAEPADVVGVLLEIADDDTLILFETPSFDALVRRHRFDQVFHEHIHYFSLASFQMLFQRVGAQMLGFRENYHDWGAIIVAFKKGASSRSKAPAGQLQWDIAAIRDRYELFRRQTASAADTLASLTGAPIYGYGAARMLPTLAYHMGTDLAMLEAVLDDDPDKDGLYYWNLPLQIRHPSSCPAWEDGSVLLTALDNAQPIMRRLMSHRPRHVVYPLNIL